MNFVCGSHSLLPFLGELMIPTMDQIPEKHGKMSAEFGLVETKLSKSMKSGILQQVMKEPH
jgi:hypothetical protein